MRGRRRGCSSHSTSAPGPDSEKQPRRPLKAAADEELHLSGCSGTSSPLGIAAYCTAFIMSKIGRYMATTMPPTMTPRTTIIIGSIRDSRALTATSTSSS